MDKQGGTSANFHDSHAVEHLIDEGDRGKIGHFDAAYNGNRVASGATVFLLPVIAAPIFEEFVFRGLVFKGLSWNLRLAISVVGSAAVFSDSSFLPRIVSLAPRALRSVRKPCYIPTG